MKKQKVSRNQRLARKGAKRNAIAAAKKMGQPEASLSPVQRARNAAATFAVSTCMMTRNMFGIGIGHVILGRTISPYRVALGFFLVDVHCLGIKNAFYAERSHEDLSDLVKRLAGDLALVDIAPECARKIVDGAVSYAKSLGFSPHPDYLAANALFGDIDAADCGIDYEFGLNGRPFYMPGPKDTPAKVSKIMQTLRTGVGDGNFEFMIEARGLGRVGGELLGRKEKDHG